MPGGRCRLRDAVAAGQLQPLRVRPHRTTAHQRGGLRHIRGERGGGGGARAAGAGAGCPRHVTGRPRPRPLHVMPLARLSAAISVAGLRQRLVVCCAVFCAGGPRLGESAAAGPGSERQ